MNVWAVGPYVWCVGPHAHAVIEIATTNLQHADLHHNIRTKLSEGSVDAVCRDEYRRENADGCLDLALGQDGQIISQDVQSLSPTLIVLPNHLGISEHHVLSSCARSAKTRAPPGTEVAPPHSLIIKHTIVLLI